MAAVDRVAKNGDNTAQNYKYAMAADVYAAVRGELTKRFVLLVPNLEDMKFSTIPTKSGGSLNLCTARVRFDFVDAQTGEVISIIAVGQGSDAGDKAVYKAMTGATKAVLVQAFLIPTGDDPENEKADRASPPPPAGMAGVKAKMPKTVAPTASSGSVRAAHDRELVYPFGTTKGFAIGAVNPDGSYAVDGKSLTFWIDKLSKENADPGKSKWHTKNSQTIATLQAEQRFRSASATSAAPPSEATPYGSDGADEPPPLGDDDAPPF